MQTQICLYNNPLLKIIWRRTQNTHNKHKKKKQYTDLGDKHKQYTHDYPLAKGGYVFGSIGLSVNLFVCKQHYSISHG